MSGAHAGGEGLLSVGLLIFALVSLLVAALVIYNSFRTLLAGRLREVALLYSGSLSAVETGTGGIALSATETSALHVTVGGTVSVAGHPFVVDATFSDGVLDETAVISWTDLTKVLGPGEDTEVAVKARPGVSTAAAASAVDAAVADYPLIDITSEASLRAHMISSIQKIATLFDALLATSIVIALFGMANTLSLSVLERTRESALLRALGLTRQGLQWMISMEAMLLGLMGAVAGVAFGIGFGWATGRAFLRTDGGPVRYPVLQIIGYIALAGVAALVASVIPARRAARRTVIDGLAGDLSRPDTLTVTWQGSRWVPPPLAGADAVGGTPASSRFSVSIAGVWHPAARLRGPGRHRRHRHIPRADPSTRSSAPSS